ncbi:S41 family peptidase [Arenimonas sp. MALMAid1274]|uniref:S41 family peptidase n=1 Tax=Arenimonas sp. MALMAid1274 TaxID=3411630 RepID=UPI003BA0BE39
MAAIAAAAPPSHATTPPSPLRADTLLDGAGLVADVDLLERAWTQLHPGLHRYSTPEQMQARFEATRRELKGGATLAQAYLAFSRLAATVRCGHTYANFYNQSKPVQAALFEQGGHLPFHFLWRDGRMVVTANGSGDASLIPGTVITRVNGIDTSDLLAALLTVARADGGNDAKRIAQMQVQGDDRIEAFDVFLPLLFPGMAQGYELRVQRPGETSPGDVHVDGLDPAGRRAMAAPVAEDPAAPAWTLDLADPQLAVLRMPGWALYDSQWDWKAFLARSFETLVRDEVPALVIDLRGNEGGLSVGDVLLSRLASGTVTMPRVRHEVRYRKVPDDLLPHLDTWDDSFRDWGDQAVPSRPGFYTLTRWHAADGSESIAPVAPRYAGKVFVIIGPTNSSATFEFARQVRASGLATLVGQPTGGNRRGINGGAFFFLRLPNSGLELDVPLVGQFPVADEPDAGVEPDVRVAPTDDDIAAGRDAEMAAIRVRLGAGLPSPGPDQDGKNQSARSR